MISWGISFQTSFWGMNVTVVAREGQGTPSRGPLLEHPRRVDHAVSSEDFGVEGAGASLSGMWVQQMWAHLLTPCPAGDLSLPVLWGSAHPEVTALFLSGREKTGAGEGSTRHSQLCT